MKKEKEVDTAVVVQTIWNDANPHERKLVKITSIKTQEDFDLVATQLKNLKAYRKIAEEKMDGIITPILNAIEKIKTLFQPFLSRVDTLEKQYKCMMLEFEIDKETKKKNLTAQLQSGKIKSLGTYTRKMEELEVKGTNSSTRTTYKAVILDEKKIPRQFLVPNMKAISKALKEGNVVPGAELKENKIIAV